MGQPGKSLSRSTVGVFEGVDGYKRYRLKPDEQILLREHRTQPNTLILGDTHLPFCLSGYLDHCRDAAQRYACGTVVHIGDFVDAHAVSRHAKDPDGQSAGDEFRRAQKLARRWYKAFPDLVLTLGNHDMRPYRIAFDQGIPERFLRTIHAALDMPPGWRCVEEWEAGGVLFRHKGGSGKTPALSFAQRAGVNTVCGHVHTAGGAHYLHQRHRPLWGLDTGCGVDRQAYAMRYAADMPVSMAIGCGVLLEGGTLPMFVPMKVEV